MGYDLLPTFAALAGVDPPVDRAIGGQDLSPLLGARPFQRGRPLYWEFDGYYATSRTCEIGLERATGCPWRSIWRLLDEASR